MANFCLFETRLTFFACFALMVCAQCPINQLSLPDYLTYESENATIASGTSLPVKCNDSSLFLKPEAENNTLFLECSNEEFENVTWPLCVVKCLTEDIGLEFGYAPASGFYLTQ